MIRENYPTSDAQDDSPTGFPPCEIGGVDYERLTALFEPLKTDQDFRRKLTYRHSELGVMIYLLSQQQLFADDVLVHIDDQ